MQANHHNNMHGVGIDEWPTLNGQSLDSNADDIWSDLSITECPEEAREEGSEEGGHKKGGLRARSPHPGPPGSETDGLAGKPRNGQYPEDRPRHECIGDSQAESKPATTQIRLRLPKEFADYLDRQLHGVRGELFVAVVFGQIPTMQRPTEYTRAVQCLQRMAVLLQYALQRDLDEPLATGARQAIRLISQLSRKTCPGCAYRRLRMPAAYAAALPNSLRQREYLVRIAVRASSMSISLRQLVAIAQSLDELRNRLLERLGSDADACPAEEVRKIVEAVLGLVESRKKRVAK